MNDNYKSCKSCFPRLLHGSSKTYHTCQNCANETIVMDDAFFDNYATNYAQ